MTGDWLLWASDSNWGRPRMHMSSKKKLVGNLDTTCDHGRKVTWLLAAAAEASSSARLSKGNRGTQTSIIVHSANGNVGSKLQVMLPGQPRPLICEWLPKNSIADLGTSSIQQCTKQISSASTSLSCYTVAAGFIAVQGKKEPRV